MLGPARLVAVAAALVAATAVSVAAAAPLDEPARSNLTAWRVDPPPVAVADPNERASRELVDLVNEARQEAGLPPVSWQPQVGAAAQVHSEYQASIGRLSHVGPGGTDTADRLRDEGFDWYSWAENVGAGFAEPGDLLAVWLASGSHRENLLGAYTYAGGGVAATESGIPYWTLVLANGS